MYVGLKQPRGNGERYVTPARAAAKETTKLPNRIHRTNAYSVKKIYLFLESNDQYGRKKKFNTVVLLYNERISIGILKNQPPNVRNVNSYRKVLQTCSKAVRPCR